MNFKELSDLIYPDPAHTAGEYEAMYPERDLPAGAKVTRLGPSPTGFIHMGNLYGAFADERLAHRSGGVFYLRIEDTDDKRYVENAVETIITALDFFGIEFDEGATLEGDLGNYGDYTQSRRSDIYQAFAKSLIEKGLAYPCFLTEEKIAVIRKEQEARKLTPGIYAGWSKYRDWYGDSNIAEEVETRLKKGDPFVIRLKSRGVPNTSSEETGRHRVVDAVRGELWLPDNFMDIVLIKQNGLPTYHFAHVVDDHLMRTTHVVRGEEWLPSLPVHLELFEDLGWEPPVYCHTAQLMKIGEDGNRRKLSKRKDPELSLDFYRKEGYHPSAVREYLLTLLNSNYEEWRLENPDSDSNDFPFTTEKMPTSGALYDLNKLNDISKSTLLRTDARDLASWLKSWSSEFAPEYGYVFRDMDYLAAILDIGRHDARPRADLVYARQIMDFISYFFDETFEIRDEYPAEAAADAREILKKYLESYNHGDDNVQWFSKIREIAVELGYAAKPKEYKKNPDAYKGHVGHVSTVIRIALTGRAQSPDIWSIQQIMGEAAVRQRIEKALWQSDDER